MEAQRLIATLRAQVQRHVLQLPVRIFENVKTTLTTTANVTSLGTFFMGMKRDAVTPLDYSFDDLELAGAEVLVAKNVAKNS